MKIIPYAIFLTVSLSAFSQFSSNRDGILNPIKPKSEFFIFGSLNSFKYNTKLISSSSFGYNFSEENIKAWIVMNLNYDVGFSLLPGRLILVVPDSSVLQNKTDLAARPNHFEFNSPFWGHTAIAYKSWEFSGGIGILQQKYNSEKAEIVELEPQLAYLQWNNSESSQTDMIATFSAAYQWNNFRIGTGATNLSLFSAKKGDTSELIDLKPKPFIILEFNYLENNSLFEVNEDYYKINQDIFLPYLWGGFSQYSNCYISYTSSYQNFPFQNLSLGFKYPVTKNINFNLQFESVWNDDVQLSSNRFFQIKNSQNLKPSEQLNSIIPHQALIAGFSYSFNEERRLNYVKSVRSQLLQHHIYLAKNSFYSFNPIGSVDLVNKGKEVARFILTVNTSEGIGEYKSDVIELFPGEMKTVPYYLYFSKAILTDKSKIAELILKIVDESESESLLLNNFPVTFHDENSWDGNTYNLKYYLTPNEPGILKYSKSIYLEVEEKNKLKGKTDNFQTLQLFITAIGKDLKYISDPVTSLSIDQVQFPSETFEKKSGDCEDLVVFIASSLMSIGFECAVVDIKPNLPENIQIPTAKPGSIGHVFLLVDTGIPTEKAGDTGMNEFQTLSRRNQFGKTTLWIPIETTIISQGFESSFKEGVKQYYQEVIEKDGITNGTVHIYDF